MMFVKLYLYSRVFPRRRIAFNIPTEQMRYFRLFICLIPVFGLCFDLFGKCLYVFIYAYGGETMCLCVSDRNTLAVSVRMVNRGENHGASIPRFPMKFNQRQKIFITTENMKLDIALMFLFILHFRNAIR